LTDAVEFPGTIAREEVPKLLSSAAAGLAFLRKNSTLDYAVPTKAYEYASCGTPFLVADLVESRALAEASGGGLVCESTAQGLAAKMLWILEHPTEAKEMGQRGRAYVVKNYDRSIAARKMLETLASVVQVKSGSA
jgi:glycosyltransferase involved in cell wall biosynthesis